MPCPSDRERLRGGTVLPALALLVASVAMAGWLAFRPVAGEPVVAVFSPLASADQALAAATAAGARIIGRAGLPASWIVAPDPGDGLPRLRAAGAWLLLNARTFALCSGPVFRGTAS